MSRRGVLITFEGLEGSGKTTQIGLLASRLEAEGAAVLTTREPGGTPPGEEIRRVVLGTPALDPRAELFCYLASRAQHTIRVLLPALAARQVVLCDRFSDATLAYQGCGRQLGLRWVARLEKVASRGLRPHLTILLDLTPEEGLARLAGRSVTNQLDHETLEFYHRVREGYLLLSRRAPKRIKVIRAAQATEVVAKEVYDLVQGFLTSTRGS